MIFCIYSQEMEVQYKYLMPYNEEIEFQLLKFKYTIMKGQQIITL